jgi:hypothetical protein
MPVRAAAGHAAMAALAFAFAYGPAVARAEAQKMKPLEDTELSAVSGRDGFAFNISGFSLSPADGALTTITYAMPGSTTSNPRTLTLSNFALSRTDDPSPFTDPYYLDIVQQLAGGPDVIRVSFPQNTALTQLWNFGTDLGIAADALTFDLGNLQLKNLALQGGRLDITAPTAPGVEGVAFGLHLNASLESLTLRPRGAADSTEMLSISGFHLHDAASVGSAWAIADVYPDQNVDGTRKNPIHPGLFNAITETGPDGKPVSSLHLQIGWPTTPEEVPKGALQIDKIAFTSGGVTTDLGSSRIQGIQINYMDIKFRAGVGGP